jgi:hypothetical protein
MGKEDVDGSECEYQGGRVGDGFDVGVRDFWGW